MRDNPSNKHTQNQTKVPIQHDTLELCNVDYVSSSAKSSQFGEMFYIFEDNKAVIKMIIKGRRPTMRHVSRTHGFALDWLFDRINLDPKIQIKYVDTKHQLADILTKGIFTSDEWNNLFHLCNISQFSSFAALPAAQKRWRKGCNKDKTESRPMLNLDLNEASSSTVLSPNAPNRLGILGAPSRKGLILQESTGKPAATDSNQNDAASGSQVWQTDAERDGSTRRLDAIETNQDLLNFRESSEGTRRLVALMADSRM